MILYPLRFKPIFQYRIWGGENLKKVLKKTCEGDSIGESWEISAVPENETFVSNGAYKGWTINKLIEEFGDQFLGNKVMKGSGSQFPLLIKFIDSKSPLSIQVHPNNNLAKQRHNSLGKNEMWYVMPSATDASITVGFKKSIKSTEYKELLETKTITEVLNTTQVKEGDTFYIPSGRVHAIGAGVMLAEIQQSSNITYRIYDYDRIDDSTGKKRELHTDLALEAIDFELLHNYDSLYEKNEDELNKLVDSPFFKTHFLKLTKELHRNLSDTDSFVIYMCVKGSITLRYKSIDYLLVMGHTILIPAAINKISFHNPDMAELIEIFI
jgi:mannose-6-phosphate isomerase